MELLKFQLNRHYHWSLWVNGYFETFLFLFLSPSLFGASIPFVCDPVHSSLHSPLPSVALLVPRAMEGLTNSHRPVESIVFHFPLLCGERKVLRA